MIYFPCDKCPRGLDTCEPLGMVESDPVDESDEKSFFCTGRNDGTMAPAAQDIYTKCFKGKLDDDMKFYDKRDLIHEQYATSWALAIIEEDAID